MLLEALTSMYVTRGRGEGEKRRKIAKGEGQRAKNFILVVEHS